VTVNTVLKEYGVVPVVGTVLTAQKTAEPLVSTVPVEG
jgi:hypothetical protein